MSALEPTREQFDAVERLLADVAKAALPGDGVLAWNLIRDMVLEAAAVKCGVVDVRHSDFFARLIRNMKGTP